MSSSFWNVSVKNMTAGQAVLLGLAIVAAIWVAGAAVHTAASALPSQNR